MVGNNHIGIITMGIGIIIGIIHHIDSDRAFLANLVNIDGV